MKKTVKIALIAFVLIIAINITAIVFGLDGKSPTPTPTPRPSVIATSTPTPEPTVTAVPTQTPTTDITPTTTPEFTQAGTPTPTPTPEPTGTATTTATPTSTSQPTASSTPYQTPAPTQTSGPTSTPIPTSSSNPTQTTAPTPTQTPATTVTVNTISQVNKGGTFTIDININNVAYMAYACFDLQFNSNYINYNSCNPTSQIGSGSGTADATIMQPGLLRIIIAYDSYASTNGGNGVSGSGYLCKLTFSATAQGTSQLAFVGSPQCLTLVKWVSYSESIITNVGWTNSSITVY